MNRFGETLRKIRIERNMSQDEFAALLGTSKQVISRYENGLRSPRVSIVADYAERLGVPIGYLTGYDNQLTFDIIPSNVRPVSDLHRQRVPHIGSVAAGAPIYAPDDLGVYVDSPVDADAALTVQGDSMAPTYLDGDLIYIKCRPDVPDGAVAVVFLDDEAVLKHIYKRPTGLTFWSDNPEYPPKMIEFDDYANVRIFGVPVGYTRIYKKSPMKGLKKGMKEKG